MGNKCDINEKANFDDEINKLTKKLKLKYFETSAKTGKNIKNVFIYLTKKILTKIKMIILSS